MRVVLAAMAFLMVHGAWAAGNPAAPPQSSIKGEVLEVKDVDAYTYLRLKTREGELWAAVTRAQVKPGAEVTIENATVMSNFESKALKRKFDRIVFGSLGASTAAGQGTVHGSPAKASDAANVKVARAAGPDGRTVAEIFGKKGALKDKAVVVRGKVVKVTQNVMGKNWVHLRDGTGSSADQTNDLLVTTREQAQVGDVIVAKGVLRTEVDLGSGYKYAVLVDGATLQK